MIICDSALREQLTSSVPPDTLKAVFEQHTQNISRYEKLDKYYKGEHAILERKMSAGLPNNKVVCNFAKYISDIATGFLIGKPVSYSSQSLDLTELLALFQACDCDYINSETAKDCSVFGVGRELLYMDAEAQTRIANVDPRNGFVVFDDTVERRPMFAVHYYTKPDETVVANVYTDAKVFSFAGKDTDSLEQTGVMPHYYGGVPMIEYRNNEEEQGDFEQVISLIDAYNQMTSDRLNAKEQDIDSLLVLSGIQIPDTDEAKSMREHKLIVLPDGGSAQFLLKQLSEGDNEIMRSALLDDIHKFSMVPNMSDREFAGNSSGVAMRYKLLAFEQLTAIKERYFRRGLAERLRLILYVLGVKGGAPGTAQDVVISFSRNLPANEYELAQMVSLLTGIVSPETLLRQLPFVQDAAAEAEVVETQKAEAAKSNADRFAYDDTGDAQ